MDEQQEARRVDRRKFWYVAHPISQYNEDVKELARQNNLRVRDIQFKALGNATDKPPKLTVNKDAAAAAAARYKVRPTQAERAEAALNDALQRVKQLEDKLAAQESPDKK